MPQSRGSGLSQPAATVGVADWECMVEAIRRPASRDTRNVASPQKAELTRQESNKENFLNKLAVCIASENYSAWSPHALRKEISETIECANFRDAVAWIIYLIIDEKTGRMTFSPNEQNIYGHSHMAAMMPSTIDKEVSAKLGWVNFEICPHQTIYEILSSPLYLLKVCEALFNTHKFLGLVYGLIKTEAYRVKKVSSKRDKQIKWFAQTAEKTWSVRSPQFSDTPPRNIFDDRSRENVFSITGLHKEERCRRKTKSRDPRTSEKIEKPKSA